MSWAGTVASVATTRRTVDRSGHRTRGGQETKETARAKKAMASKGKKGKGKGKGKGKSKGKGKLNSVENWQEGGSETGAQGDEHADGWTWSGESKLKDGGKRQMISTDQVQDSG